MEIKQLSEYIQFFKNIRNEIEVGVFNLGQEDGEAAKEEDNQDRMGFEHSLSKVENEMVSSALGNVKYGLKQINEGICELEMAYRRSIRLKKPVKEVKPEKKLKGKGE